FAFIAIQVFGVQALGISYFAKFINTPALGNMDKNPMGAMDFVVGLLEIISELAKIVSFGFRLFGNIFAGQVLLFVMTFLVATLLPAIFYGLELFVGLIQAFVFAMLLLVFSTMAMAGHGHDDEEHH
ncbi:MAG: F0F1 ATP synthase subunit A, partial [Anaerolineae bacterium]|nr:F0F1 ATP synthase subunit A [Anaerolineae bacterium]